MDPISRYASAREQLASLRVGRVTSAGLVAAALARCREVNPLLNAVVSLDEAGAAAAARAADLKAARGEVLGPLHGLPVTIKDSFEVAGLPAVNGVPELRGHRPARHAEAVRRLVDAGAIVIGKTNVPAYSLDLQTFNEVFGLTRNPWDPERTPGGSSGGAAVALATGITALELGHDLAGSLRLPAHFTGVCSLLPSHGVVPVAGLMSPSPGLLRTPDLVAAGPMARTVADLALMLDVLAGPGTADAVAWRLELPPARAPARRLRVAAWLDDPGCPVDTGVGGVLDAACAALAGDGVALDRTARPSFEPAEYLRTFFQLMYGEMSAGFPPAVFRGFSLAAQRAVTDAEWTPLAGMPRAVAQTHRDWLLACEQRARYRADWAEFFTRHDVLLTPVSPQTAPRHDQRPFEQRTVRLGGRDHAYMQQAFWCALATVAGLPAAIVPAGLAPDGLPVGIQVIAPRFHERTALELAALLERLLGGFRPPPSCPAGP